MMNMWKLSLRMSGHDEHVETLSLSRCRAMMNMWKLPLKMSGHDEQVEALSQDVGP